MRTNIDSKFVQVEYLHEDNEFCTLLYNVFAEHITHFNYRSFSVFDSNNDVLTEKSVCVAFVRTRRLQALNTNSYIMLQMIHFGTGIHASRAKLFSTSMFRFLWYG